MLSIWNIIFHNPLIYSDHLSKAVVKGGDHSMLGKITLFKLLVEHTWFHKHGLRRCGMTLCIVFLYNVNASPSLFACVIICVLCLGISWYCICIWIYFRSCQDIDECEQFKDRILCVGECFNQPGSYSCRCPEGYRIGSDGRTCQGERIIIIVNLNCNFYVQYYALC